jgi:hypothetical protein
MHEGADSHKLCLCDYDNKLLSLISESEYVRCGRLVDELVARTV